MKFLVRRDAGPDIHAWVRRHLQPDVHGGGALGDEYHITSLYCDTPGLDVFHRRGSFGRAKYRVRRYETMADVFLERKLRTGDMLAKRRTLVPLASLDNLRAEPVASWPGMWFRDRVLVRRLTPTCQVSYRRTARVGSPADGLMRLTIDDDVRVVAADDFRFRDERGQPLLPQHLIVELKFSGSLPPLFHHFLQVFQPQPGSLSKYRLAFGTLKQMGSGAAAAGPGATRPSSVRPFAPCPEPAHGAEVVDAGEAAAAGDTFKGALAGALA